MRKMTISFWPELDGDASLVSISELMDKLPCHAIDQQPWHEFFTTATAKVAFAHKSDCLLLKYYLEENELNAISRDTNSEISLDNCVELFIAFDDNGYYNLEFNCLGSVKVAYGKERKSRILLPTALIEKIKIQTAINSKADDNKALSWQIFLMIPKELFAYTAIDSFDGLNCRANFYKCGDGLKEPHFLTWSKIETPAPDFHQPAYFGNIHFQPNVVYAQ